LSLTEFGKVIPAAKLYALPDALLPGESVAPGLDVRNQFFSAVYNLVERSAANGGAAMGSHFW
jgi:hypothetical protein